MFSRGHEGQLLHDVLFDDLRVDDQAGGHVLVEVQDGVHSQEGLGARRCACWRSRPGCARTTAVAVVMAGLHGVGHDVAGQGADALAAHGVALVGHGGGADLVLLKGLLHLLHVAQQAQVRGELVGGLGDAGQGGEHSGSPPSGSRSGRRPGLDAGQSPSPRRSSAPAALTLLVVAVEQLQESWPGCRWCPWQPSSFRVVNAVLHLLQVHEQLVHPQGGPLADGDQLGGLEVGVAQGGQGLVLRRRTWPGRPGRCTSLSRTSARPSRMRMMSVLSPT